jgi:hypothetical protein
VVKIDALEKKISLGIIFAMFSAFYIFLHSLTTISLNFYHYLTGFSPMENKMHLVRELTYSNTGEKLTWNLTAAGPELVAKKEGSNGKFQPQGVFEAGFVTKVTNNQVFGASLMHRRQINPMMGGLTKAYDGSLILIHTHENEVSLHPKVNGKFSDGFPSLTAEASTSVMLNTDGVMPKELVFEHVTRGGTKHSPCELVANLSIGKDPMPIQYGGTGGIKSTGFLGISQKNCGQPKENSEKSDADGWQFAEHGRRYSS